MTAESPLVEDTRMDVGAIFGAVFARWLRILIVTLLMAGIAYALLSVTPKLYESYSSILVESRDNAFVGPVTSGAGGGGAAVTIDSVISSQIELIKSRDTLLKVVDAVNLRSVPEFNGSGPNPMNLVFQLFGRKPEQKSIDDTVLANLAEKLTVIRERDSAIISIFVRAQDPQLAADIANAIANEHVKRRTDLSLQDTAEASTWLEQEIVKLRERVAEAETKVANFRSQNDLFEGSNNTSLVNQQLSNIANQVTDAQQRKNAAQTRATLIRRMIDAGQSIEGMADVQNSAVIQQLSQSKADLQGQLAQRSSTLLPNHPTMRALNAQIREIDRQIAAEGRRVAASLEAEAKIEGDLEASLQDQLSALKQSASTAATSTVTLDELQREAKAQRDLLESYLLRYRDAVSRSDSASALPDVRVVTVAAPSVTPASPKTGLVLGAVIFGALALQIGAIMLGELVSGRAVVARVPVTDRRTVLVERETITEPDGPVVDADEPLLPFDAPARVRPGTGAAGAALGAAAAARMVRADAELKRSDETTIVSEIATAAPIVEAETAAAAAEIVAATTAPPAETIAEPLEVFETAVPTVERVLEPETVTGASPATEVGPEPAPEDLQTVPEVEPSETQRKARTKTVQSEATLEAVAAEMARNLGEDREAAPAETRASAVGETSRVSPVETVAAPVTDEAPKPRKRRSGRDAAAAFRAALEPKKKGAVAAEPGVEAAATPAAAPAIDAAAVAADPVATVEPQGAEEQLSPAAPAEDVAADAAATEEDLRRPYVPAPIAQVQMPELSARYPSNLATLSADIALGRVRVVMVAGLSSAEDCLPVVDSLVAEALYAGLSIVRVDAGSGDVSQEAGITDLAAEMASFGDVVHKGTRDGLAEVPWGHQVVLDRRSARPNTLVEALTDIYEVVVVITGRVGLSSSLPLFAGINSRLVLSASGRPNPDHLEAALADVSALGFRNAQVVIAPDRQAQVA